MHNLLPVEQDETLDTLCGGQIKIIQKKNGYRFSIDAILLANFITLKKNERLLDIGTGCGIIPLYLAYRGHRNEMVGVEIQKKLFECSTRNAAMNNYGNIHFLMGDMRTMVSELTDPAFHVIVSNPPFTSTGTGRKNPEESRLVARHETYLAMTDLIDCSSRLLNKKGRLYLIYPVKRLAELIHSAMGKRLELKRLRFIYPKMPEKPNLFLAEFVKDGGRGVAIEKPLSIYENNMYCEEVKNYYT